MRNSLLLGLLTLAACFTDPAGPGEYRPGGQVRFTIAVADAGTVDKDGYWLAYGESRMPIRRSGFSFIHPDVPAGLLTTRLDSLESWCTADPVEQTVEIVADQLNDVAFDVSCAQMYGTARVIVQSTLVDDPDPNGYILTGPTGPGSAAVNDTVDLQLPARVSSTVTLSGFASWCRSTQPQRTVTPDVGDTIVVTITVDCETAFANARILANVAGDDPANDTVFVRLGGGTPQPLLVGTPKIFAVRRDRAWVVIDDVPTSCVNLSQDSIPLSLAVGAPPDSTTEIAVGCGRITVFASAAYGWPTPPSGGERRSVGLDGQGIQVTGTGLEGLALPALSPDRSAIAGTQSTFDWDAAKWRYTLVVQPAGGGPPQFPQTGSPEDSAWTYPTWNHNGTRLIGYTRSAAGAIHHVAFDPTGGNLDTLPLPLNASPGAVESPDGQFIAYFRPVPGPVGGVLVIARTSDFVTVESYPASGEGMTIAWSPDASRLAFSGGSSVWVLSRSTGISTRLAFPPDDGSDFAPEWSSDGKLIVFRRFHCCTADPYWHPAVVSSAGGRVREVTTVRIWGGPYWPR
jgi:hypothetical protein